MSVARLFKYAYVAYVAKPQADRTIYKLIRQHKVRSIVELGMGDGGRTRRMIDVAQQYTDDQVRYTGIDLFEARTDPSTGLAYKDAHQVLKQTPAKVRLVPGDPLTALSRAANDLMSTDLLVIAADQEQDSLEKAWFYIPRMLTEKSIVCREEIVSEKETRFRLLSTTDVQQLAGAESTQLARAA